MVTPKKPEFRSDKERNKWLGTQLGMSPSSNTLDPALAALAASGALPRDMVKKLSKAMKREKGEDLKTLKELLDTGIVKIDKAVDTKIKKSVKSSVQSAFSKQAKDEHRDEAVNASTRRKQEKAQKEEWAKQQKVNELALDKVVQQIQKEMEQKTTKADKARLEKLKTAYKDIQAKYKSSTGSQSDKEQIEKLEEKVEDLLEKIKADGASARISVALDNALDRATDLQDKLEARYKKREDKLKDMDKSIQDFKKNLLEGTAKKIGIGAFNLHNAMNLGKNVRNKFRSAKELYSNYKDLKHYRKTGEVAGYARGLPHASGALVGEASTIPIPTTAGLPTGAEESSTPSSNATESYRQKVITELKAIAHSAKKKGGGALDKSSDMMGGLQKSLSTFVDGVGGSLAKFGSGLLSTVGPALAVAAAGAIGYKVGQWLEDQPWFRKTLGSEGLAGRAANVVGKMTTGFDSSPEAQAKRDAKDTADINKAAEAAKARRNARLAKPATTSSVPPPATESSSGAASSGNAATDARSQVSTSTPTLSSTTGSDSSSATTPVSPSAPSGGAPSGDMASQRGKLFKTTGDVDVSGVNPGVSSNFLGMAQDYKDKTGKTISVNSAFRSNEKQAQLYDQNVKSGSPKKVAKPGTSLHNYGYALDVNSSDGNALDQSGLLSKWGFSRPVSGEPWHLQPAGISLAAAKQGVYSADFASDQGAGSSKSVLTKGSGTSTAMSDSFTPPPNPKTDGSSGATSGTLASTGSNGVAGSVGSSIGINDVPMFSTVDGSLLAMNVGALGA